MSIMDVEIKCVGCGACVDSCPNDALYMALNENGFYKPILKKQSCINCGKCTEVCPTLDYTSNKRYGIYYYGWINDERIRMNSSSGGAFSALAKQCLDKDGVVFGANYASDNKSVVMSSTQECTLDELRRSKYCQSRANGVFRKIDDCLKAGKFVMLTGTPCQIAAARKIFGNDDNLLLVSFICGGVVPETAFANYVDWLEKKYDSRVIAINMRDKTKGWNSACMRIEMENGKQYFKRYQFDYYHHYYNSTNLKNDACLSCKFTENSDADITISDYWGARIEKLKHDDKGLSLICAFTPKGQLIVDKIQNDMILFSLRPEQVEYAFKEKKYSEKALEDRRKFLALVNQKGFVQAAIDDHFKGGTAGIILQIIRRRILKNNEQKK